MTYSVASPTLDSAGSYVMQDAPFTQGTISSIPIDGSISPEGFLPSFLLLVVVIVTVVVVIVILIVVVDDVSLILKLSFVIIGIPVGPVFLLGLLALAIVAACASRAVKAFSNQLLMSSQRKENSLSNSKYLRFDSHDASDITKSLREKMGKSFCFLGGNNSSGTKKFGSNSSDGGNTEDGVKIADGVIGSGGGIGAEVEHPEPGFELLAWKRVEIGTFSFKRNGIYEVIDAVAEAREEEKRIAKEKEAAELEAKHKIQECLNIEEKSIPQASTRSRKFRIDPTLRNFTISTKRIPFSTVETVNSLKMGDKHLDTQKVHLNLVLKILFQSQVSPTSSVDDLVPTPSESADLSDGENDLNFSPQSSSYDLDDEIIINEKFLPNQKDLDVVIPIPPGIDERCFNAESDLLESLQNREIPIDLTKIDSILDEFSLPRPSEIPFFSQDEMDLVFDDLIPPGIDDDDDSEGDILFVEPVATMENNIEELNEDESFDPGGGGNVVLPNVEEDDTFTFTIRTFLPFVTYPEVSLLSCSTRSEDTIFDPGISTFHFSSLKPVAYENPMVIFLFFCFCPKDKGIRGELRGTVEMSVDCQYGVQRWPGHVSSRLLFHGRRMEPIELDSWHLACDSSLVLAKDTWEVMWGSYGMSKKVAMQGGGVGEGLGGSLLAAASKEVTRGILSQEIIRCLQEGDGAS
ncbi:hypothetical protein Tco_0572744 [Tanacetum coccineum]